MQRFENTFTIVHRVNRQDVRTRCRVVIEINMHELFATLGYRALQNKSRKTKQLSGMVRATAIPLGPGTGDNG